MFNKRTYDGHLGIVLKVVLCCLLAATGTSRRSVGGVSLFFSASFGISSLFVQLSFSLLLLSTCLQWTVVVSCE